MHHRMRIALAAATLIVLVAVAGGTALAGNYVEVEITAGMGEPSAVGEERELRFSLLQHGVTPVDHGQVLVTATLPGAESVTVPATSLGDGAWTATLALPSPGEWRLRVTHSVFETPDAVAFSVVDTPIGWSAAVIPIAGIALAALAVVATATILSRRVPAPPAATTEPSIR
jgi:hypothetical protein